MKSEHVRMYLARSILTTACLKMIIIMFKAEYLRL